MSGFDVEDFPGDNDVPRDIHLVSVGFVLPVHVDDVRRRQASIGCPYAVDVQAALPQRITG